MLNIMNNVTPPPPQQLGDLKMCIFQWELPLLQRVHEFTVIMLCFHDKSVRKLVLTVSQFW